MKHGFLKWIGGLATVLFCLALIPLLILGAAAEDGDGGEPVKEEPIRYGIYLGGESVTNENCKDILGGRIATYDPVKNLLTITGGQNTEIGSTPMVTGDEEAKPLGTYSLYTTIPDLRVEISGTVTFTHGIYVKTGSVLIKGNATNLTFLGGSDSPTYITVGDGNLTVQDGSKISVKSLASLKNDSPIENNCFSATTLLIQGSVIRVDDNGTVSSFKHVLFGKQTVRIRESTVDYHAHLMGCDTFLASDGLIQIAGSTVRAQNVRVFLLLGNGKLSVASNSILEASNCYRGMQLGGDVEWKKSTIGISSYYSGIELSSEGVFRAQDCKITLRQPGYAALERDVLLPNAGDAPSAEKYLADSRAEYEAAVRKAENAGFYVSRTTMEFSNCWLDIAGYLTGIFYRSSGRTLSFRDGSRLSVDAVRASFVALVTNADSVSFGSRMSGDIAVQVLPAETVLGEFGKYIVTLVNADEELVLVNDRRIGSPQGVLDAYDGFAQKAETTIDEFRLSTVVLPLGILFAAFACAVGVYLICRRVRHTHDGRTGAGTAPTEQLPDRGEGTDENAG